MKDSPTGDIISTASEIIKIRDLYNPSTKIIVNDDLEATLLSKADGVHLGQEDMDLEKVKSKYSHLTVGWSTHTIEQIRKANAVDIDYIGFGPVFQTSTKKVTDAVVTDFVQQAAQISEHRIVFIGGINKNNIVFLPAGDKIYYALISGLNDIITEKSYE